MPVILLGKYYRLMGVYVKKTSSRYPAWQGFRLSAMIGNSGYTVKNAGDRYSVHADWNKYEGLNTRLGAPAILPSQNIIRANKRAVWARGVNGTLC